ncbi:hypothetical protein NIES4075_48810 [Tolypothrix sp. NIES-4075]|uniref:hypothetical protein n=1 Tax=Tolypothrix sp. NIES-4075 TaxID=2005459 RepID=UPI000B6BE3BE|nr:hypothetical protein NIES4075_48810 [Tolypothrix sp. NIES-4075]
MKLFKAILIGLLILVNLVFVQPSFADKPKFTKNPDYIEVTKALQSLKTAQSIQAQGENTNPQEIQKKIDELEFQKYTLETGTSWGQCTNQTDKTLAVYGPQPDEDDVGEDYPYDTALYFLAPGRTTKEKWDCNGVYLPNDAKVTAISSNQQGEELARSGAIKIVDGTQLVAKTNPDTSAVELNIPATQVFKAGDLNWFIPNVSQAIIDTRVANAPSTKIAEKNLVVVQKNLEKDTVQKNLEKQTVEPEIPTETEPQVQPLRRYDEPRIPKQGYYYKRP